MHTIDDVVAYVWPGVNRAFKDYERARAVAMRAKKRLAAWRTLEIEARALQEALAQPVATQAWESAAQLMTRAAQLRRAQGQAVNRLIKRARKLGLT